MLLVLWDLDHTLLEVRNVSREAYAVGFERVTGVRLTRLAPMAGRTDRAIIAETFHLHALEPSEEMVDRVGTAVGEEYAARSAQVPGNGRVLPGALEALRELGRLADVHQSVLTGNMRPIALVKLSSLGLADRLDLASGAFGMDHAERWRLVSMAARRAEAALGLADLAIAPEDTVLIGDTPLDVAAAAAAGARAIAVATGASSAADLRAAGAATVFEDLTDTARLVRAVRGSA
ncbi:haloacid dehalogenase-like hydrolase [Pseudonocardia acaciae]|uniref:haloacid dehalogenase-like hydrolase n=1 Tax=Pseudonocardia acaciae TaxID=551276 RepID=UPI00068466A8|nr:haloacid dehalogenase-like hydrolase [Pseudonocardia acaciae]